MRQRKIEKWKRTPDGAWEMVGKASPPFGPMFVDEEGCKWVYRGRGGKKLGCYLAVQPELGRTSSVPWRNPDGKASIVERLAKELYWWRRTRWAQNADKRRQIGVIRVRENADGTQALIRNGRKIRIVEHGKEARGKDGYAPIYGGTYIVVAENGRRWLFGSTRDGSKRIDADAPTDNGGKLIATWTDEITDDEPGLNVYGKQHPLKRKGKKNAEQE